ncbi:ABC transporter permease [Solitalea canadensis]|uniref:ABC-type transport system, involved in lipoprotein release, permease component n=1 Tax=Solitalea canadensis (strain ATCC 29591 / DSM 3403 / JCM 21819 / LMG 8368 / NBRC 15130 / NCIMB 12057 / USAM 9D) TaxID=929556 RepID=H8KSU3_SOLCM|nr:ABC transporter permease [Solitalea canadensis]AFD05403.1 ABC-type transport system, involved in lipoprotein release, permease component [Solitalea canadensis DSM 3403]
MIKSYFKIAYRTIVRHKGYAAINITGLAIGIAACLLLFLVIRFEMSYNSFFPDNKNIYRVVTDSHDANGADYTPGVPYPALDALRTDFPQLKTGALFSAYGSQITIPVSEQKVSADDKKFIEETGIFFADPQFFEIVKFKWLVGDEKLMATPNTVVLTQKMAEKYFGDWHNAVGKIIKIDNAIPLKVSGILENVPFNTDFPLEVVVSFITSKNNPSQYNYTTRWGSVTSNFQVFMQLPSNVSPEGINKQLANFINKHRGADEQEKITSYLQPLTEVHYDARYGSFSDHTISKSTLITLSLIGVLIIIMACINFINLSTAQAIGRSKEVGVRKVLGSNRVQLLWQMMGETALIVFFSMVLALVISTVALPYLAQIIKLPETISLFTVPNLLFLIGVSIVVTIFSGIYPALILSGFKPALALKNKISSANIGGISLRRGLVVTQFAMSQILVVGTIVAVAQMSFVRNADLGFNKEAVYVLTSASDSVVVSRHKALKEELLQMPGVSSATFCSDVPSSDMNWGSNFAFDGRPDEKFDVFLKFGDADYFKTFDLKLIAGRGFAQSDTINEYVINETLMHKLGVTDAKTIIGKSVKLGSRRALPIVGVVKDFKINSLREAIKPLLISTRKSVYRSLVVKLNTSEISKAKVAIEQKWNKYNPEYAFTSTFFDENIARFYQQEEQLSKLYKIFAGLAIFISCLGLYGLVSFMAVQRTKEVGIRKVLGASVGNIVYLFSKEFTVLIVIAFIIAAPVAYYVMHNWLNNFVFRVNIGVGVFAMSILISLTVAWLTVGYKAVKAALANPVKSLRTE